VDGPRPARTNENSKTERDTSLISHRIAMDMHKERQREIERRLELRSMGLRPGRRLPLRRRVGQTLIRLGRAIDPDAPAVLAAPR
jgi:hypothetical protein